MATTSTTTDAAAAKGQWDPLAALMLSTDDAASYMSVDDRRAWFTMLDAALKALELDTELDEQESFESPELELAMASAVIGARGFQD